MKEKLTELIKRYRSDDVFRSRVILYRGTLLNTCYAIFKLTTGIWFVSTWLIAIAVFYLILLFIKFFLVMQDIRVLQYKREASLLFYLPCLHSDGDWPYASRKLLPK